MDRLESENNPETGFEREDLAPRSIYVFLIGMALFATLAYFALKGFFLFLNAYAKPAAVVNPLTPAQNSDVSTETHDQMADQIGKTFPEPRLEENERMEIRQFRDTEDNLLNRYGWADKPGGMARIPIARAMELTAERGLPTRPQAGTTPASTVELARQAAKKADTSAGQKKK